MDEQASFEPRAVLVPRRRRINRLALLVPVAAFAAIAWAGVNGPRPDLTAVVSPDPTSIAAPSIPVEAAFPVEAIGLTVERLGDVQLGRLGFDSVVAIAGWYVPTGSECLPVPAFIRGDADRRVLCVRSGILYTSRPHLATERPSGGAPTGVAVTVGVGVNMPRELEVIGTEATQVVVIGRFAKSSVECGGGIGCRRELLIDRVAWTPDV
jgi:hypothetical protein